MSPAGDAGPPVVIVVTGHLRLEPDRRAAYLDGCHAVVALARGTPGCLDFALSPDLLDAGRVNVLEVWESAEALARFRGDGPDDDQQAALLGADVRELRVRPPAEGDAVDSQA